MQYLPVPRACMPTLFALMLSVLAASAYGATLVVANKAEATASLIDLTSGTVVATLPTDDGPHEVGMSPDGRFALVTNYGTRGQAGHSLTLIDVPNATVLKKIELSDHTRPHGVEWLDDRHAAITVEDKKALVVLDVETGAIVRTIGTDQDVTHMVALAPEAQRAYTANIGSGSITVIDLERGERERSIPTGAGAEGIAVTDAGARIWVTNREDDTVTVLDADTLETVKELSSKGFPIRATATPRGQVLVTRARAGDLVVYSAETLEEVRTVPFDLTSMDVDERLFGDRFGDSSVPIGVVVDDTGDRAWVAHANADVITEIDLATGDITRYLRAGKEPDGMGFSPHSVKR